VLGPVWFRLSFRASSVASSITFVRGESVISVGDVGRSPRPPMKSKAPRDNARDSSPHRRRIRDRRWRAADQGAARVDGAPSLCQKVEAASLDLVRTDNRQRAGPY